MLAKRENGEKCLMWFEVPCGNVDKAVEVMKGVDAVAIDPLPAFEDCTPADDGEASTALRSLRRRDELTQAQLAKLTGIKQGDISKMENGKLSIGKERAKVFAMVFKTSYKVFL